MRNRGLLWTVIALGLLLAAPELRRLIHNSIRPEDENVAFENLAEVSALQLREQHAVEFSATMPNDARWRRVTQSWGDPGYEIALVSQHDRFQYCFDGIGVAVSQNGRPLEVLDAGGIYAFGSAESFPRDCKSVGKMFHVPPGLEVRISLSTNV